MLKRKFQIQTEVVTQCLLGQIDRQANTAFSAGPPAERVSYRQQGVADITMSLLLPM